MENNYAPRPEQVATIAKLVNCLAEELSTQPGELVAAWQHRNGQTAFYLTAALGEILPGCEYAWTTPADDNFYRLIEFARFDGWDGDTLGGLLLAARRALSWERHNGERQLPRDISEAIISVARAVQDTAETIEAERARLMNMAEGQRQRAIDAGKSRIPLRPEQIRDAIRDIDARIASGDKLQTACKALAPKYGVSYSSLQRYYRQALTHE